MFMNGVEKTINIMLDVINMYKECEWGCHEKSFIDIW